MGGNEGCGVRDSGLERWMGGWVGERMRETDRVIGMRVDVEDQGVRDRVYERVCEGIHMSVCITWRGC